jgi:hypothetical protein
MFLARPGRRFFLLMLVAVLGSWLLSGPLSSAPGGGQGSGRGPAYAPYVPGDVLIKFKPGTGPSERANIRAQLAAQKVSAFRSGFEHWRLGPGRNTEQTIAQYRGNPHVAYIEPNYVVGINVAPNDPRYPELWGMHNTGQTGGTAGVDIDAERAWNVSTGSSSVVVAVIDTGIDYNHPDLAANVWTNPGEIAGNGVDDDGNGFIDDIHGWDFVNHDNNPFDDNNHGTHCSGTIGGAGDNAVGVAGVNWHVKIMALKFLNGGGSGSTADAVSAIDYGTMMGVDVMSNSWGGGGFSQALLDAINGAAAADIVFVAAAGNGGSDGVGDDNDVTPNYPSNYDAPNVIAVAATDHIDARASFSNYGLHTVDLAAPGVDILSTTPGATYSVFSGTSMATPHVAGACALIRAVSPGISAVNLKQVLLSFVDPIPAMAGRSVSGGRLNIFFPIAEPDNTAPGFVDDLATETPTSNSLFLRWTATGDDGATGTASSYDIRYSTALIDDGNFSAAAPVAGAPLPAPSGTVQTMEALGLDPDTTYYFAMKVKDEWGNIGALGNVAYGTTLPAPTFASSPDSFSASLLTGQATTRTLTIENVGVGTLDWRIPLPAVSGPAVSQQEPLPVEKGEPDPRSGQPVIDGFGGPDVFGYRWMDSDEPGGPAFSWTDIALSGTPIAELNGDDQISNVIPLGFNFSFYGTTFDAVRVSTNGWLSFTSTVATGTGSYSNQVLPTGGTTYPENLIAPFWDDLHFRGVSRAVYQASGGTFIVQFTDVDRYTTGSDLTFQVEFNTSGEIVYRYLTMGGVVDDATLGLQNPTRTDGLTVAFNTAYVHDNLAVRIAAVPQWLTASPTSGRLFAGQHADVALIIDATGLDGGIFESDVIVQTNDPGRPSVPHPVTLTVTGAPAIEAVPASLDFGQLFVGYTRDLTLSVNNTGTGILTVSSITSGDPLVTATPSAFTVAAHAGRIVTVRYAPTAPGVLNSALTISSDGANAPVLSVSVVGSAVPAPVLATDPTSFSETLFTGGSVARNLRLTNNGGSDLVVNLSVDLGTVAQAGDVSASGSGGGDEPGVLRAGGPDAFGYRYRDSDEVGGPTFAWTDISAMGTTISFPSPDDSITAAAIPLGMTFPYYAGSFSSIKVSTNGWLTFSTAYTGSSLATNGTMPSTAGLPASSIALFWDDLHLRTGNVKYLFDGSKFILQATAIGKFSPSTGQSFTMQVQLYPSGRILMQYLTMTGTVNQATIGIQDGTRTVGLQVVKDAAYMHDNLAIEFARIPNWLAVSPTSATIPPGGFRDFGVTFNAGDSGDRLFSGAVKINTNIPSLVTVPATLQVLGVADVATDPTSVDYGTRFVGYPAVVPFFVRNVGTADLTVAGVTSDEPDLHVDEPPTTAGVFVIPAGGSVMYNLRWLPTSPGPLNAVVAVQSDDPDEPTLNVPVVGNGIPAPILGYSPGSFTGSMLAGETASPQTLTLTNSGGSDLTYNLGLRLTDAAVVPIESKELAKGEEPAEHGDAVTLGAGGPDNFGYRWKDSDEPGGPAFDWVDISAIGTPITTLTGDDQGSAPITLGFDFPFYGNVFNSIRVNTNGWLSFTSTITSGTNSFSNAALPSGGTAFPENLLAAFWDDLDFRGAQHAKTYYDGTRFIVQYSNVDRHTTPVSNLTFQVILYPTGKIVYQYLTMAGGLDSATIGIQNATRDDGLTVAFNQAYVHDNLAIQLLPIAEWIHASPAAGTIAPGDTADIQVVLDATELIGGLYNGGLTLVTNDPANARVDLPVSLQVTGFPAITPTPTSLDFGTVFVGVTSAAQNLTIRNTGSDVLVVSSCAIDGEYAGDMSAFSLPVGATRTIALTFSPTTDGPRPGSVTFTSNATSDPVLTVPLSGTGLFPPVAGVDPASLEVALPPGGSTDRTLQVCNTGGSDLDWQASVTLLSALGAPPATYPQLDLAKDEEDPRVGILGSGGPDLFGYHWNDSDEPGGPAFDWVDISAIGTPVPVLNGDDQNSGAIPIGFSFPYYGNSFSSVRVATNGWLSFTSTVSTGPASYSNTALPTGGTTSPENLLAAFWDDLDFRGTSHAKYFNDGTRFIVQYTDVDRHLAPVSDLTFQVVLYPSGRIVYQYLTMAGGLDSATIGIQNAARNDGLTVVFDATYVHDNLAIEFTRIPEWLTVDPASGVTAAGACTDVQVHLDAAGLSDGDHDGIVVVRSNDPFDDRINVPVLLHVGEVTLTYLDVEPHSVNLSSNGTTIKATLQLPLPYDPHDIVVSSVSIDGTLFANPSPVSFADVNGDGIQELEVRFDRAVFEAMVPPGDEVPVTVTGEVRDTIWFRGTDTVRALRPHVMSPNGGEYLVGGEAATLAWSAPAGVGNVTYDVILSRDGGNTWESLASGLTATSLAWTVNGPSTSDARIRVFALDARGVTGYDTSDAGFSIAAALLPPRDAYELGLAFDATDLILQWKRPDPDLTHGPVEWYRIYRAASPQGPFNLIGEVTAETLRVSLSTQQGDPVLYYNVLAGNGAGPAAD